MLETDPAEARATQETSASVLFEDSQFHSLYSTSCFSKESIEKQLQEIFDEIVILQSYARSINKIIPENVLNDLGKLVDSRLQNGDKLGEILKLALSVHGRLSQVVAPVSVRSLKSTDLNQGTLKWLKQIWAIFVIFISTLIAFGFYIYHSDLNNQIKTPNPTEIQMNKLSGENK